MKKFILLFFVCFFTKIDAQERIKKTDLGQSAITLCKTCKKSTAEMTILTNTFESDLIVDQGGDHKIVTAFKKRKWVVISKQVSTTSPTPEITIPNRYLIKDSSSGEIREVASDQNFYPMEEVNYYFVFHRIKQGEEKPMYVVSYIKKIDPTDTEQAIVLSQ